MTRRVSLCVTWSCDAQGIPVRHTSQNDFATKINHENLQKQNWKICNFKNKKKVGKPPRSNPTGITGRSPTVRGTSRSTTIPARRQVISFLSISTHTYFRSVYTHIFQVQFPHTHFKSVSTHTFLVKNIAKFWPEMCVLKLTRNLKKTRWSEILIPSQGQSLSKIRIGIWIVCNGSFLHDFSFLRFFNDYSAVF